MYIISENPDHIRDIKAHEEMNGNQPVTYKKGNQYAIKVSANHPVGKMVEKLGREWGLWEKS